LQLGWIAGGSMAIKPTADFRNFEALDIRAGRIIQVDDAQTRKPTYRLTIDFGPEIGTKVSCGAYRNYPKEALLGKTVVCIVNFAVKKMGPEISEVLVLGITNAVGETIYLTAEQGVPLGGVVF
jgi:tRNA-binding protein